ncbi:MAG: hypothetical protein DI598_12870 [Pseudopedobacter saltans]|uniref:Uncharacterized protein n=1 Tax=Pseudopedobacter saltans TaxID=151895 RepID=A0A2W5GRF7_9SPHI|nr:MAG: hypothetical protein DI598_12870 [Pseudopedobacter saltans]
MIKDRYRLEETSTSLKMQPSYYLFQKNFKLYLGLLGIAVVLIPLMKRFWGSNGLVTAIAIASIMVIYLIRDYCFRINVKYIFDKSTRSIYKTNLPFVNNKKLMNFDEMIIFTSTDSGALYYSLGIKQKQLLKSYKISESFDSGKRSEKAKVEYESEILSKILLITDYKII